MSKEKEPWTQQAIITKCLGPTNTLGVRIKVKAYAGEMVFTWDYNIGAEKNHFNAAYEYLKAKGWDDFNSLIGGSMPDNSGYAFVQVLKRK